MNFFGKKIAYKNQELVQILYPVSGTTNINLTFARPIDMVRISVYDSLIVTGYNPGLLVWCDIVNNYIGTCLTEHVAPTGVGANYDFNKTSKPQNGICFWYPQKIIVNGDYEVKFTRFNNTIPTNILANGDVYILFEYFAFEN